MVTINNIKVYDLEESIVAASYAMLITQDGIAERVANLRKWINNPDFLEFVKAYHNKLGVSEYAFYSNFNNDSDFKTAVKDVERIIKLANTPPGSGHRNAIKGIRVSFDIKYPNYFTPELQRYNFVDIVCSNSKMHRLLKMNMDACFNKYVIQKNKEMMKDLISDYNETPTYENFMRVLSNCPQGVELFMRCSTNYEQLATIYRQRKNHKLKEDWGAFCRFIEELPLAQELIIN